MLNSKLLGAVIALVAVCLSPVAAWAQVASSGGIAGVVRDATGAVLPGVTVEAASPALIEKARTVVTDDRGQYNIVDLRPGVYTVTFTLPGFSTVTRRGVELTTGFTATVNAELKVGGVEETITVTGASPIVDTRNVRTQNVVSRQMLESLPTSKGLPAFVAVTVGATMAATGGLTQDVGGNRSENTAEMLIHGMRQGEGDQTIDGMSYKTNSGGGSGGLRLTRPAEAFIQEVTITTGGTSAEYQTGGAQENVVPRDGGNRFSVYFASAGSNNDLQGSNLTDELRARGTTRIGELRKIYEVNGGVGGPIVRDRLWFYAAYKRTISSEYWPGVYFNSTPNTIGPYVPNLSRPAFNEYRINAQTNRVTWQLTPKQKIATNQILEVRCHCALLQGNASGEALWDVHRDHPPLYIGQYTWNYARTNRLLFEAGAAQNRIYTHNSPPPGVAPDAVSLLELSSGIVYNAPRFTFPGPGTLAGPKNTNVGQNNGRVAVSYVTGSHAFKVGLNMQLDRVHIPYSFIPSSPQGFPVHYNFRNGRPAQIVQWASPGTMLTNARQFAGYVQDQWTVRKLTFNLGVRFDRINGFIPEQDRPGGVFVPALHIDRVENVPNFTDVNPRVGVAYDVFGNGKTAVKVNVGRYVAAMGAQFGITQNPANQIVASTTRTWTDANNNFVPDCVLTNNAANGECGAIDNRAFGTVRPNVTWDKSVTEGFGNRFHNWQFSAVVQQELAPGLGLNVGYFRTWFGNFTVIDNVLTTPADFTTFCMSAPSDSRLPNGGGYQICDLSDVIPSKFGQVQNVVTDASNFGDPEEMYDGVDATMNWRFGQGGLLMGGMNVGRKITQCVAPDGPVQFCRQVEPWLTQVKVAASYPLPWGLAASAVYQGLAGLPIATPTAGATWVVTNAQVRSLLGRDLAAGPNAVKSILLYSPTQEYEDRLNQLDVRLSKVLNLPGVRVQPTVDVYNILNVGTVLLTSSTFPRNYLAPRQILSPRLLKFGVQLNY